MINLHKGDILYYSRIIPETNIYEVCELKIRTVEEDWFVGTDKHDKHAYLLSKNDIDKIVFTDRKEALNVVMLAEENKTNYSLETYYEEY